MKIGFIGLGIMGSRMAANLLRGGHELTVYNRTASKAAALRKDGAGTAKSPADAARGCDIVFTMLSDPAAVELAAVGDEGLLSAMESGSVWIDCSTVNPAFSRRMAEEAAKHNVSFLDAPVAGTKAPAEKGELTVLVGGDAATLDRVRPLLELIGNRIVHVGATGGGTSMKMVVNLMLAGAMATFSEALTLGQALGLSFETVAGALVGGPVTAPFLAAKRPKIEHGDYDTEFPLRLMQKDLHLAATEAFERGVPLPASNAVKELYAMAVRVGLGDLDFSAVYRALNPDR